MRAARLPSLAWLQKISHEIHSYYCMKPSKFKAKQCALFSIMCTVWYIILCVIIQHCSIVPFDQHMSDIAIINSLTSHQECCKQCCHSNYCIKPPKINFMTNFLGQLEWQNYSLCHLEYATLTSEYRNTSYFVLHVLLYTQLLIWLSLSLHRSLVNSGLQSGQY